MIPARITKGHIDDAISRIIRDGVPPRRRGRSYCLVKDGKHLPPKYTIALAHQVATGEWLGSDQFSGGRESNEFLRGRGFVIVECSCGGSGPNPPVAPTPSASTQITGNDSSRRHSERCQECKIRIAQVLERIYGACVRNHRFGWPTVLTAYEESPIGSALRDVARVLEENRGFGTPEFVRTKTLAGCDSWVPDPGFIVEFDESQHFTTPRRLALSAYSDTDCLGFSAKRWTELCERHDATDNDPPFRDEQRAWYDTLRDLVPLTRDMKPTVRLYARDQVWCSLNPDSAEDRERFADLMREGSPPLSRTSVEIRSDSDQPRPTLRVAMVFPPADWTSDVPTASSFAGEAIDFVLFPEGYIAASDQERSEALKRLASDLGAPLLVGASDKSFAFTDREHQVLLRFDPGGSRSRVSTKHSTAKAVAFERPDWEPRSMLPTFELCGVTAGATICHDHYLGLLTRSIARRGARLWVNPSYDNVVDLKWSSILRLRAMENRLFALCTLHHDTDKRTKTHPFGFAPNGTELVARRVASNTAVPLSQCVEADNIYIVDLDLAAVGEPLDWSNVPLPKKPKRPQKDNPRKPVRVALRRGQPTAVGYSSRYTIDSDFQAETVHGPVYVGVVPGERILDAAECFRVLDRAKQMDCAPIIWNHWEQLPTESARLATLMMGRAIECCAPIVISDRDEIYELVELANYNKFPVRRLIESSGEAIVDLGYAWGLDSAFKMVTAHLPKKMRAKLAGSALDRYRSLS